MAESTQQHLRDEISFLGEQLGWVIRHIEGDAAFESVERIRHLARDFRQGNDIARVELADMIPGLDPARQRVVIRAFSIFLDLANLAEDRHRLRVLRHRLRHGATGYQQHSIHDAIATLRERNVPPKALQQLVGKLDVELVFTAHPTEAKRRSVRSKLRHLRNYLRQLDGDLLPGEREELGDQIRNELVKLWQTDLVRPKRPTVMQEVERGLSIKRALWDTLPAIVNDLRDSLCGEYANDDFEVGRILHYGSWIGGDRDGHPDVTVEMTEQTVRWLRWAAIEFHWGQCQRMRRSLTFSSQYSAGAASLEAEAEERLLQWRALASLLEDIPENEPFRRWLILISWRLDQTRRSLGDRRLRTGSYRSAHELAADVQKIRDCLDESTNALTIRYEIQPWLDRIAAFGLHVARLDIRQDAAVHRKAVNELLKSARIASDPDSLDETARCELLVGTYDDPMDIDESQLTESTRETIELFRWLAGAVKTYGYEAFGGYVISMTRRPSDFLHVLWLWQYARQNDSIGIPVIPLFETIDDLKKADLTLDAILDNGICRAHVEHWHDQLTVMLGYSDGTKDGGYLAACWSLFDAQRRLTKVAQKRQLELTFFHGRGGSLGRGGGPAARSILALPEDSFHGQLRLTEQGEVLAERYDDPRIAYRHLEQILWATILAAVGEVPSAEPLWHEIMQYLAKTSRITYRELIDDPHFAGFLRTTTPLEIIETLPIGSRPARRNSTMGLEGLRAIPFVFSWTQCRWLVPAWYGLGSAAAALKREKPYWYAELPKMYQQWPFFQAIIDNATLALAKADVSIGRYYGQLACGDPPTQQLCERIHEEYDSTRAAVLEITSTSELLEQIAWLKESIHVRNFYIDPLNMIQVELLRRIQSGEDVGTAEDIDSLLHLTRMTINGVASGMRTTG